MTIHRFSPEIRGLLFDMDMTLYTNQEYLQAQIDLIMQRLADKQGMSLEEMRKVFAAQRKARQEAQGGRQISLGNTFESFGVSMEETIRWREELYEPERFLSDDPRLRNALETLSARYSLALVTNNPTLTANRTLKALGVQEFFPVIVGLDTCGVSKPHEAPLRMAAELLGLGIKECASIGDRYDIDVALPLELGMGGILVDGVQDVYDLPGALEAHNANPGVS